MGGSRHELDARAGWTDVVRDQAPLLHAVGYALSGSLPDAEVLLQAALEESAARWDPEEYDDPHDDARRLLVESLRVLVATFERGNLQPVDLGSRLVVTQPPPAGHDPELESRLPAWQRLHAIAREHRAPLVLRHLPATSELDVARVLGARRRDLPEREQRAAAAFGGGLADLSEALAAVVAQLPEVVVDADAEARLLRPGRRRREIWTVLGLAGLLAVTIGLGVAVVTADPEEPPRPPGLDLDPLTPESGPGPVDRLPLGDATTLPYWADGILRVGDRAYRTVVPRSLQWAGGTTVVSGAGRSQVVTRDAVAGLPGGITSVQLAPDGRLVAWVVAQQVVAAEVQDDGRLGPPVTFDASELAGPEDVVRIQSVLTDGRILVQVADVPVGTEVDGGSAGRAVVWTPGEEPVEVRLPGGILLDFDPVPWPGGISWLDPGRGIVLSRVGANGSVRPVGRLDYGGGAWDAEGRVMAQVYATVPYVLSPFDGGFAPTRLPLPPPRDRSWQVVGWEDEQRVVVAVAGPGFLTRTLVRCTVPELSCERVGGGPDGRAVLPG